MFQRFKGSYLSYIFIFFFFFFCMAAFSSVLSVYLTGLGIRVQDMSWIVSASGIFSFATIPLAGYLSDLTRRPRLIAGIMMIAVGVFAVLFSVSRTVFALFLLNGLTMSFIMGTQPIFERLAGASRYRYGVLRVWGTIGYAVGAQAAGLIFDHFSSSVLFICVLAAGLICAFGCGGADDPLVQEADTKKEPSKIRLSTFLSNSHYLLFFIITVLFWGCSGANMTYVPILLKSLSVSTSSIGTVISLSTLVEIPLILFSNRFMDRFSGKSLIYFACGLTLIEFLIYGLVSSAPLVIAVIILLKAIATTTYVMIILKVVSNLVRPELITTGLSVVNTGSSLGTIGMQNIGGALVERFSVQNFYLIMAGLIVLTMILTSLLKVSNDVKTFG